MFKLVPPPKLPRAPFPSFPLSSPPSLHPLYAFINYQVLYFCWYVFLFIFLLFHIFLSFLIRTFFIYYFVFFFVFHFFLCFVLFLFFFILSLLLSFLLFPTSCDHPQKSPQNLSQDNLEIELNAIILVDYPLHFGKELQ